MKTTFSLIFAVFSLAVFAADDPALFGHWPIGDGAGTVVKDLGPGKRDARICNPEGISWVDGRVGGKALRLGDAPKGKAAFIAIEKLAPAEFSNGLTIMLWFQPDPKHFTNQAIWDLAISGKAATGFRLCIHWGRIILGNGAALAKYAASNKNTKPIKPGIWHHFAATHDGKGTFKVYIDGELVGTSDAKMSGPILPGKTFLSVGSAAGYGPAFGVISDLWLYKRALTDAEILQHCDR